jgi:hypothetical protein
MGLSNDLVIRPGTADGLPIRGQSFGLRDVWRGWDNPSFYLSPCMHAQHIPTAGEGGAGR